MNTACNILVPFLYVKGQHAVTESIPSVLYGVCMYISGVVHRLGGHEFSRSCRRYRIYTNACYELLVKYMSVCLYFS